MQTQPGTKKTALPAGAKKVPVKKKNTGCYFRDGIRRVDYILVWEETLSSSNDKAEQQRAAYRRKFEENLIGQGIEIEKDSISSKSKKIHFVKLFVSWHTMCYYAEYLGFRAPLELFELESPDSFKLVSKSPMEQNVPNKPKQFYTCAFSATKLEKYLGSDDQDSYFKPTQRFEVAFEILGTQVYGKKEKSEVGLDRMLKDGIYIGAMPPHDGPYELPEGKFQPEQLNARQVLFAYWAQWGTVCKYQPLDHVREYFGENIAFYFAFLGYYTTWLVPASIVGLMVFIYGLAEMTSHPVINETCNSGKSFKMCPLCDNKDSCGYWYLSDICKYIKVSYVFDNNGTVLYAVFASLWACAFLEAWKRRAAILAHRWDVTDFVEVEERPRPEYTSRCTEYRRDPVTGSLEPYFPFQKRMPRLILGALSVVLMLCLSSTCMIVMLIIRAVILSSLFKNEVFRSRALTIANTSSACINLLMVLVLELVYEVVAVSITDWEMHRTQTQFENMLILKVSIFEFFNYYMSITYTALVKGNISGRPGAYNTFFGTRFAQCINGSCMYELAQLLAVILVGKQLAVNMIELLFPMLLRWMHRWCMGIQLDQFKASKQWEADYLLIPYKQGLLMEYLEVMLQFSFTTLFVPAFPLAPLFALINNLMEIRLDARKLVCGTQRPLPQRAQSIGVWFSVLQFIVSVATISNAMLMAFTSEFLPLWVYRLVYNVNLEGYKNFTLSRAQVNTTSEPCRYNDVFSTDMAHEEYFWKLLCARLIFALSFQQFVLALGSLLSWLVPDVPKDVELKIRREKYMAKQALIDAEWQQGGMGLPVQAHTRRAGFVA